MLPVVKFLSFTFGFVQQLQTAETTIFLVKENILHSGLDGTIFLYTILTCFDANYSHFCNQEMRSGFYIVPLLLILKSAALAWF
jgi:hypothetical protein